MSQKENAIGIGKQTLGYHSQPQVAIALLESSRHRNQGRLRLLPATNGVTGNSCENPDGEGMSKDRVRFLFRAKLLLARGRATTVPQANLD